MQIGLPPWGLKKFEETVRSIVSAEKLNRFDAKLNGIVLDIQSIKVMGTEYAVRNDSSALHVSLNVRFYVFQPRIGAVMNGIVKHVALHHISVTIHRFFNVTIPLEIKNGTLKTNMQVMVKLTKFDLDDSIPYFEGKLEKILWQDQKENSTDIGVSTTDSTKINVKRERITNGQNQYDSDSDSSSETSRPKVKREIDNNGTVNKSDSDSSDDSNIKIKVKKEPVSSRESSSSESSGVKKSTDKLQRPSQLQITSNNKMKPSLSTSSDDSTSSDEADTANHRKKPGRAVKTMNNSKRKRSSDSSSTDEPPSKIKKVRSRSASSSSSSSSNDISFKKKIEDRSTDASFASPGLSSTKISTKNKTKCKDSGTNEFLKKMMSRFDK